MRNYVNNRKSKMEVKDVKIFFPQGTDQRILTAAVELEATTHVDPIVLGDKEAVEGLAKEEKLDISTLELIDPKHCGYKDELAASFVERRKGKVTHEQADDILNDANYFGTMMVYTGRADGLVSGSVH